MATAESGSGADAAGGCCRTAPGGGCSWGCQDERCRGRGGGAVQDAGSASVAAALAEGDARQENRERQGNQGGSQRRGGAGPPDHEMRRDEGAAHAGEAGRIKQTGDHPPPMGLRLPGKRAAGSADPRAGRGLRSRARRGRMRDAGRLSGGRLRRSGCRPLALCAGHGQAGGMQRIGDRRAPGRTGERSCCRSRAVGREAARRALACGARGDPARALGPAP